MTKYRSEAEFSAALLRSWRNRNLGYKIQRVESPTTGRGIPDLFIETSDYSYWIELKREKIEFFKSRGPITIGWRENQQTWMLEKYIASGRKRPCFTFVAFDDCIIAITMNKRYRNNSIEKKDASHIWLSVGDVSL